MVEDTPSGASSSEFRQLTQVHVPLDAAADALATQDADDHTPIVVVTTQRRRMHVGILMIATLMLVLTLGSQVLFTFQMWIGMIAAVVLAGIGLYRLLYIMIPDGAHALVVRNGKYNQTIASGSHVLLPWDSVSHVVTRRDIPYVVIVVDAKTQDHVQATLEVVLTFVITDPYRFVYGLPIDTFDQLLQASAQKVLRVLVSSTPCDRIVDLIGRDMADVRHAINEEVAGYGVMIRKLTTADARPPKEFVLAQEAQTMAEIKREIEAYRLRTYADAVQYEQESARVQLARTLAANSRALIKATARHNGTDNES